MWPGHACLGDERFPVRQRPYQVYVIDNLECGGRLLNIYSELVSDALFQGSRARLYIIGQIVVGFAFERIADGEWLVFWNEQAIGEGELRTDVVTSIVHNQGVI